MEIQSTSCKCDDIGLSEINTNCMLVWEVNNITYAAFSDISANCLHRALHVFYHTTAEV